MKYQGNNYTAANLGKNFTFGVMWHVCPARDLDVTNENDVILAVENAYRDMMPRTINGIGLAKLDKIPARTVKNVYKDALRSVKTDLLDELRMNLAENIIDKVFSVDGARGSFNDGIHQKLCDDFVCDFKAKMRSLNKEIEEFNNKYSADVAAVDESKITYGKAQKIVNMTMKQLYCFDNADKYHDTVFSFCHIPIDSIILEFFKFKVEKGWSGIESYSDYMRIQDECKKQWDEKTDALGIEGDFKKLFFAEFIIWDAGTERKGKKKLNIDSIEISP